MNHAIQIGLVEDQLLFRQGIKSILNSSPDFNVIFESADGHSVLKKLAQLSTLPDVMLVDISLPPLGAQAYSGADLTQALHLAYPDMKVIILSVHDEESFIADLIELGAHGYLVKDCDPQEMYEAIVAVHTRGTYINDRSLKALLQHRGRSRPKPKQLIEITKREEEVLALICQQLTTEEIAEKLFISTKTVNGHRNNLLQKTGSRNVTGLVLYAVKNNIIPLV